MFWILMGLLIASGITFVVTLIMYMPRLRAWAGAMHKQKRVKSEKNHKLALLVPAKNESKAIGAFIDSIKRQTYGKEYFDTHVIVSDPNDVTLDMIKAIGAIPHVIENQTCKGDALDGAIQEILKTTPKLYDGYIIIDADCVLGDTFLEEMNNALASGRQIIQAKRKVKNYLSASKKDMSLSAACNALIWTIIDDMGNRYKSDHNITNMTIGTGIMLRSDVIDTLGGWVYRQTLTEDIELMYDSVVKNFSTFYYSYAEIYVEESTSLAVTNKRRTRWLTGVVDSHRIYASKVRKTGKSKALKKNKYYTNALSIVYAYVANLVLSSFIFFGIAVVLFITKDVYWLLALTLSAIEALLLYISFFALTACCLVVDGKNMKLSFLQKMCVLFVHPLFYMGYVPIIAKALLNVKNKGWEVIDRMEFASPIEMSDEEERVRRH